MKFKVFDNLADDKSQQLEKLQFERMPYESDERVLRFLEDEI